VSIHALKPIGETAPDLFDPGPDQGGASRSLRLSQALDTLNRRFGKDTVSIGPRPDLPAYIGAKIAFNRIPELEDFWE
jgi:DNA polymerase-4